MITFKQYGLILFLLTSSYLVFAGWSEKETHDEHLTTPTPVVNCLMEQPSQGKSLYKIDEQLELFTHPCSGGLYLVDKTLNPSGQLDKAVPVIQGWWLHSFNNVIQKNNELIVLAKFVTGVGPVGSRPFYARVMLQKKENSWLVGEPSHGKRAKPNKHRFITKKLYEVTSQQALEQLDPEISKEIENIDIDFATHRLVLNWVRLKSSKIWIDAVFVSKNADSYQLQFTTQAPSIVTKDLKTSLIWLVLPKDDLPVEMYNRFVHNNTVTVDTIDYGVIDRL